MEGAMRHGFLKFQPPAPGTAGAMSTNALRLAESVRPIPQYRQTVRGGFEGRAASLADPRSQERQKWSRARMFLYHQTRAREMKTRTVTRTLILVALSLNLSVTGVHAQQTPVKMTFSGTNVATTINLQ